MFDVMSNQAKSPVLLYRRSSCIKMRQQGGSPFTVFRLLYPTGRRKGDLCFPFASAIVGTNIVRLYKNAAQTIT